MGEPYIGEIRAFAFNFPPKGWALCNGQLLPINQNQALYALLGNVYGGNGVTTFALPNLQGRVPIHAGSGYSLGISGGEENHTLTVAELPVHTHWISASNEAANSNTADGKIWGITAVSAYHSSSDGKTMRADALKPAGSGQPHNNMQPYSVISYCIALQGIFPSRD